MAIDFCNTHFGRGQLEFAVAYLSQTFPLGTGSVGGIFSSNAMEPIKPIETFVSECARVPRKNGTFLWPCRPSQ
jgi:Methyltransferase domain